MLLQNSLRLLAPLSLALLAACTSPSVDGVEPEDAFLARFAQHEGMAFEGRIVANQPAQEDDPFVGQRLVMHVRHVSPDRVEIPLHVGEDRSRTWILTRTPGGLRLKHDHRHRDGREDELTQYGGDSDAPGTARRQQFPADSYSQALFEYLGYRPSMSNVWAMEIEPDRLFSYELVRPGRLFRIEFDLSRPVVPPPATWGH